MEDHECSIGDIRYITVIRGADKVRYCYFFMDYEGRILQLDLETEIPLGLTNGAFALEYQYICLSCFSEFVYWQDVIRHIEEDDPVKRNMWLNN